MSITDSLVAAMRTDHGVSPSGAPTNRDMRRKPRWACQAAARPPRLDGSGHDRDTGYECHNHHSRVETRAPWI